MIGELKAQAIELVLASMAEEGAPDWAQAAVLARLKRDTIWQHFLTAIKYSPGPRTIWSEDEDQKWSLQGNVERHGRAYWTTPIAEILDDQLWDQFLEFRWSAADFERDYPAPIESIVGQP